MLQFHHYLFRSRIFIRVVFQLSEDIPCISAVLVALLADGPRMVRDVFRLAKENAPGIIFIDEVDAIATARFDAQTGADREVQHILMELLNQMDGFDQTVNVKVIMATNRADTIDPSLLDQRAKLVFNTSAIGGTAGSSHNFSLDMICFVSL